MIVITGAAGFIGSNFARKLNNEFYNDLILVDDFSKKEKEYNLNDLIFSEKVERDVFFDWFEKNHRLIQMVFHLGARTDTAEFDKSIFDKLNLNYSKEVWKLCVLYGIPLVYASSAATYGMGELGYNDSHEILEELKPLNPYGESKNEFDKWALKQEKKPHFWAGFKFFNVYGPGEYHKSRMASVVLHAYNQITKTGKMNLFRSHNPNYTDGGQLRDFVYVKDLVEVLFFFLLNRKNSGIYNLGTGKAESFLQLAQSVFKSLDIPENISYIDTPLDIRDKYQYYTCAEISKLRAGGYDKAFMDLETGVNDYVSNYLKTFSV